MAPRRLHLPLLMLLAVAAAGETARADGVEDHALAMPMKAQGRSKYGVEPDVEHPIRRLLERQVWAIREDLAGRVEAVRDGFGRKRASRDGRIGATRLGRDAVPYDVTPLGAKYAGEDKDVLASGRMREGKRYLSRAERDQHEVFVKDGKLVDRRGRLVDTTGHNALYAMDQRGRFFVLVMTDVDLSHSVTNAGRPVAAVGYIEVKQGVLTGLNRYSGHYTPTEHFFAQAISELSARGADLSRLDRDYVQR